MKKACLYLIMIFIFLTPLYAYAESGITETQDVKIAVDGKTVTYEDAIIIVNGRTMLPLRALLISLGVQNDDKHIIWNSSEKSVVINKDTYKIKLVQGNTTGYVNGIAATLEAAPLGYSKNGRTYIPVRFVAQALGGVVYWNSELKRVDIITLSNSNYQYKKELINQLNACKDKIDSGKEAVDYYQKVYDKVKKSHDEGGASSENVEKYETAVNDYKKAVEDSTKYYNDILKEFYAN